MIAARAVQGLGGARHAAVALSLVMTLFTEQADRAKAMGIFGFVLSGGGVAGVLLGGVLTDLLSWHWIFFINIGRRGRLRPLPASPARAPGLAGGTRLDVGGALTITGSLMLAVYAIVNGNETGWVTVETLGLLAGAVVLLVAFLVIELRVAAPLVPLGIFRNRDVSSANAVGILMAAGMFAYFVFSALYLQQVFGYTPLEVGLAYLRRNGDLGACSLYSDRFVMRFGIKPPLIVGLSLMALALLLFARTPVDGSFLVDVPPATIAVGIGAGIAFNPILLAAIGGVEPQEAGLASGVVNTSFMMGGALGLAVLASLAASRTDSLESAGEAALAATNAGYHLAFLVGALFTLGAAVLAGVLIKAAVPSPRRGGAATEVA